jgi:Family of unknown function (DUF6502)
MAARARGKKKPKALRVAPLMGPARSPAADRAALNELARELMQETVETLTESGLSKAEQRRAFRHATSGKKQKHRPAKLAMQRSLALSELLTHWQRDKRYTDQHGVPKVLAIAGSGVSLTSLAKKFVPDMRVSEVVAAIVRHGEVIRMKGERVALLGTGLIVPPKTKEHTLAHITLGNQRLKAAISQNSSLPENWKNRGLMQRFVFGKLSPAAFERWSLEVRAELQRVIASLDSDLKHRTQSDRRAKDSGVGIFVFRDE